MLPEVYDAVAPTGMGRVDLLADWYCDLAVGGWGNHNTNFNSLFTLRCKLKFCYLYPMNRSTITTRPHILALLHSYTTLRPIQIHRMTGISRQHIHSVLKRLLLEGEIVRRGRTPLSYYSLATPAAQSSEAILDLEPQQQEIVDRDFIIIKKEGRVVSGTRAICDYAQEQNTDPQELADAFVQQRQKQLQSAHSAALQDKDDGATDQLQLLLEKESVSKDVFERFNFADYLSITHFGKTALAQKLHAAKSSDNGPLQIELFQEVEAQIHEYINDYQIDAVAFVPGSSAYGKRLMDRWRETLDLPLPHVNLVRAVMDTSAPQQGISLASDQTQYRHDSLIVDEHRTFDHVLLIDDQLLSGKTMSMAAQRMLDAGVTERVSGFVMTFERKL